MSGWIGAWGNAATITNLTVTGSEVISVNTSTDALRITQTGTGNALVVEDSANPDSTPFVVNSNGFVLCGAASGPQAVSGVSYPRIQCAATDAAAGFAAVNWDTYTGLGGQFQFMKSVSGAIGTRGLVSNGTVLGNVYFAGDDATNFVPAASITAAVDGTPSTNDMPGRLVFNTTADGASSPTERMRIDNGGNVYGTSGTTGMTNGFFYIPAAGGAPSGIPTAVAGRVPMYYDTINNNFYIYNGTWKKALLA